MDSTPAVRVPEGLSALGTRAAMLYADKPQMASLRASEDFTPAPYYISHELCSGTERHLPIEGGLDFEFSWQLRTDTSIITVLYGEQKRKSKRLHKVNASTRTLSSPDRPSLELQTPAPPRHATPRP